MYVTEEKRGMLSSIINKCHKQHVSERINQHKTPFSSYVYMYYFKRDNAKEYLENNLIHVTGDERSLIESW